MATIRAKSDLFNAGQCFTAGKEYHVKKQLHNTASLIDARTINDQGEPHIIGTFWREFEIVKN